MLMTAENIWCQKDFKTAFSLMQSNTAQQSATSVLGMHKE
jgi:hypothetical protein